MNSRLFASLYLQVPKPPDEINSPTDPCFARPYLSTPKPHALRWESDHHATCRHCHGIYFKKDLNHVH